MATEKADDHLDHVERTSLQHKHHEDGSIDVITGYETNFEELPKGYFYSKFFLGSMLATGLGLWAGTASFVSYMQLFSLNAFYRICI